MAVVRSDPFDPRPPQLISCQPGEALSSIVDRIGFDPILRAHAVAVIDGVEVPVEAWVETRVQDGQHVAICVVPQGGGEDGNKLLTTVLTIFIMVAAFWVSGGGLAPFLGAMFAKGTIGASVAAAAISTLGGLAIQALVKPPASALGQDKINPVYAIDGAGNQFAPFEPITFSVGRRRVFPRAAARGFQELVGDDFYYRLVLEWGPIGIDLSDIRFGDTPLSAIDGVQQQHRLVAEDPHPTLYPAGVFQQQVGAMLESFTDWEMRQSIANATQATVILGFPVGLGKTSKKGKSEQWAAQVEVRYRTVTGDPGAEEYGAWVSPPGNGVSSVRGSVMPGPGRYGFSEKKRNQPFYRAITIQFPEAGTYQVEVRRYSPNGDAEEDRVMDDIQWSIFESRRPGRPILREDVAYSVFRIKGSDETSGRIETINGIVDRLIPRFDPEFLASGDLSEAGPEHLTSVGPSSSNWEQILWLRRNGFEGREPLSNAEIDWPSFAYAEKSRAANGWQFDHVLDGAASIEEVEETIAFAACGRTFFNGNRLTAFVDEPQLAPAAIITDRKARNVRAVKRLTDPPHGYRVTFDDASDGYRTREIIVYVGGHTAETATRFEMMQVPGSVHWNNVHRLVARNYRNSQTQNRTITVEVPVEHVDASLRLGSWVALQLKVVEVGRASGWVRAVETNGLGQATAVILDQPVMQRPGEALVFQWSRQTGYGVTEELSAAVPLLAPGAETVSERVEFETPLAAAASPQIGDLYVFGVAGAYRIDGLVDDVEAVDHEWLRLHLVNYAPERFSETGLVLPPYSPAFERPAFIRPPELELVALNTETDGVVIHFRPKPGERGQIQRFVAARAIAPDADDETGAVGVWDALPDLPASARQLVAPGGQAGDVFQYRIAAVDPLGNVGPYLLVENVAAIETLGDPQDVEAVGFVEEGAGGSARAALLVTAAPDEDVNLTELVAEIRRVTLDLSDERVPEEEQPSFEPGGVAVPATGRMVIRGLPAGSRLDVEVFFRGANQAVSGRVRVADVILPDTDVAGQAADYVPGSALETFILAQASSGIDTVARDAADDALARANEAFSEAETVRAEFTAEAGDLQDQIDAKASVAQLGTVESDAEAARTLLGSQITSAYTTAINDAVSGLQTQINTKASVTRLDTVESDAASALAEGLSDVRAEFAAADVSLQTQIASKASTTQLNTAIATEEEARADAIDLVRADFASADAGLQTQINTKASTTYVDTSVANETSARSTALATRDASFKRLAWGTAPINVADKEFFTSSRAGDPQAVADISGTEVISGQGLGRSLRVTFTAAGANGLTKALFPIRAGRVCRVRMVFRVSTLPPDGTANLTAVVAGVNVAAGFSNPVSAFVPALNVSDTAARLLEFTIGDNTSVADVAFPASGSTHFRVGLRQNATETTVIDFETIEVDDITLEKGLSTDIASKASQAQLATVEANANSAISSLAVSLGAEIDGVAGDVSILNGVLSQPSGSEALIAFRANTSTGAATLKVISTSGTLSPGTKIVLDANLVLINGAAIANNTITVNHLQSNSVTTDKIAVRTIKAENIEIGGVTMQEIALSAVSKVSAAYSASDISIPDRVWTTVQTVVATTQGGTLVINCALNDAIIVNSTSRRLCRLVRNGVAFYQSPNFGHTAYFSGGNSERFFSTTLTNSPAAGTYTFELQVWAEDAPGASSHRTLVLTELKR